VSSALYDDVHAWVRLGGRAEAGDVGATWAAGPHLIDAFGGGCELARVWGGGVMAGAQAMLRLTIW
jgi:hypothetical protein